MQVLGIHDKVAGASRSIWKACLEAVDSVICSQERQKQNVRGRSVAHNERRSADVTSQITIPFTLAISGGKTNLRADRGGTMDTITVTIPQGIADGSRIRLRGQGAPGLGGGPAGDLLLDIQVEPHLIFRRQGDTLEVVLPISLAEAVNGGKVDLPTPWGTMTLTIPPRTGGGKNCEPPAWECDTPTDPQEI